MKYLPGLLTLLLAAACLGNHHDDDHHHHHDSHHDDHHESTSNIGASAGQLPKCPGMCQKTGDCLIALTETDCAEDFICCVDHLQKVAATEFADAELTTESMLDSNLVQEIGDDQEFTDGVSEDVDLTQDGQYQVVYSEESDDSILAELPEEIVQTASEGICPGSCVSTDLTETCSYVVSESPSCGTGTICCITESEIEQSGGFTDESTIVKRAAAAQFNCPGTCVHPMHAAQCQNVLNQFSCPLNTKCCVFGANSNVVPPRVQPIDCKGMCVPFRMIGYCVPPNQLLVGPSTCPAGQSCCTRNPSSGQYAEMTFPSTSYVDANSNKDILGHLAVDEMGTVFKVDNFGNASPLPRLPLSSNMFELVRLAAYPRPDGEIVIFADKSGMLYQELYPASRNGGSNQVFMQQPQQQTSFPTSQEDDLSEQEDSTDSDIVIPEDDDDVPVTASKPVDHSDKTSMPPCPGSCISHFLRFTCFRGHAIYDGFTCPGRSVCCARLTDIEDHEEYLKSMSPYFSTPAAARDPNKNRCGIKGRRDTPRVMGGKDSLPGEWCWQVAVINLQNQYICGGALIDNSWVLTAAHCVIGPMEEAQTIFVRAGVTDLKSSEDNVQSQTIKVLSTYVHHNFNALNLDNNIALLRLQKPVTLQSNVCVVCLPTNRKMPEYGTKCTVTGYGFVSPSGGMSLRIREAQVPIIDDMECMTNVTDALESPFLLPASSFCAGGEGLKDACQGDAGGALACDIGGFHELVGLVSWGLGCGRDFVPSIYVKIPAFMGWINQIISSSSFFN